MKKSLALALLPLFIASICLAAAPGSKPPPGAEGAKAALEKSPRHGEWITISMGEGKPPLKAFLVFPEKKEKAGVVIVIHEIFGLTDWVRGVADQLAADGFIAIAPDMLSGRGPNGGGTEAFTSDQVTGAVRAIGHPEAVAMLDAVREYGKKIPASNGKTGVIGFCWGGMRTFHYATAQPDIQAAAPYYGASPDTALLDKIKAPVFGFYGADDARVNVTIEPAEKAMTSQGKTYKPHIYEGAGHGFLRQQDGRNGANQKAANEAWPATVKFFQEHLK